MRGRKVGDRLGIQAGRMHVHNEEERWRQIRAGVEDEIWELKGFFSHTLYVCKKNFNIITGRLDEGR